MNRCSGFLAIGLGLSGAIWYLVEIDSLTDTAVLGAAVALMFCAVVTASIALCFGACCESCCVVGNITSGLTLLVALCFQGASLFILAVKQPICAVQSNCKIGGAGIMTICSTIFYFIAMIAAFVSPPKREGR